MIFCIALLSCKDEVKSVVKHETDPETTPTVVTYDVTSLVSDSGVTKYKITTKLWNIFEEAKEPRWTFPKGLYLEELNDKFRAIATISCDSAIYFKEQQLWRLDGNVNIKNELNEKILTNQILWDQRLHEVYSDSFIHIEKIDRVIEGRGFKSNEQLTDYRLYQVQGIFPIDESKLGANRGVQPEEN